MDISEVTFGNVVELDEIALREIVIAEITKRDAAQAEREAMAQRTKQNVSKFFERKKANIERYG